MPRRGSGILRIESDANVGDGPKAVRLALQDLLDGDCDLDGVVGRDGLLALKGHYWTLVRDQLSESDRVRLSFDASAPGS